MARPFTEKLQQLWGTVLNIVGVDREPRDAGNLQVSNKGLRVLAHLAAQDGKDGRLVLCDTSGRLGVVDAGADDVMLSWPPLSAPGVTDAFEVTHRPMSHSLAVIVANINTQVDVRLEGSMDGSNWYNMMGSDQSLGADGGFSIRSSGLARYVRGVFISEEGGTDAIVTFHYLGQR